MAETTGIQHTKQLLTNQGYIADPNITMGIFLAQKLQRPSML